jgi:hypothetical protein
VLRFVYLLPRPRGSSEDIWSWCEEETGIHSVKSAYRMLVKSTEAVSQSVGCSNSDHGGVWKKLWKLNVAPKIGVFWWRAVKKLLPC